MVNLMSNLDYIPDHLVQFLNKEKNGDIVKKIYKNIVNRSLYHAHHQDSHVFDLLPDDSKLEWILNIGAKAFSNSAIEWLKNFKKAHNREEIIKIIMDNDLLS